MKIKSKHWRSKDLKAHFGCVNALAFSHNGQFLASGGDDRRILVWNVGKTLSKSAKYQPQKNYDILHGTHESNIFCLDFSCNLVSHKEILTNELKKSQYFYKIAEKPVKVCLLSL